MAQYPHIRVFYGSDGLVHFMSFTDGSHNGQRVQIRFSGGEHLSRLVETQLVTNFL